MHRDAVGGRSGETPLLDVRDLKVTFPIRGGILSRVRARLHAVDGVSFTLEAGETLGLVGESGCGKSTLGRAVLRLVEISQGQVILMGSDITHLSRSRLRPLRRRAQIVFQDSNEALNPRKSAGAMLDEVLRVHGVAGKPERRARVRDLLGQVGLSPDHAQRFPNEFSGGQRQRLGIARALAVDPSLVVADEPVSALDVSVQAQVINLFLDLQRRHGLAYLFIAHDLAVVARICHRVAVMYLGRIVEIADRAELFRRPLHPYTLALMRSVPAARPGARAGPIPVLEGDIPSPVDRPSGCHFRTRCPAARKRCEIEEPRLEEKRSGHHAACHFA